MNSLEEMNNLEVGMAVPIWDPFNGKREAKISENSKYKISIVEEFGRISVGLRGKRSLVSEYELKKQNVEFFKESLALNNFKRSVYLGNKPDYQTKLNILTGKQN